MDKGKPETQSRFDLLVHHRDPKTGQVLKSDPYILRRIGEAGSNDRTDMWERPAGSGNLFDSNNNPIGRWLYEEKIIKGKKIRTGKHDPNAKHIEWAPPETKDQKIARENAALRAELEALKAEKEKALTANQKKDKGA